MYSLVVLRYMYSCILVFSAVLFVLCIPCNVVMSILLFLFTFIIIFNDNNDIHACTIQTHYCYTIYFNESTVLLTSTTNQPTVPLTYPWTASLPMMALATDLTRDMLRRL